MLEEYTKKRNFNRTPEPSGSKRKSSSKAPTFVIQEHHASHLHYDFRLEIAGTLKSWAVPKGIPTTYTEKHLAVATEDHPLEYANFEGVIPAGEYGGGTVKIWDKGIYENITYNKDKKLTSIEQALSNGHILFTLHGKKLKDKCFVLQKFKTKNHKEHWLLVKVKNEKNPTKRTI